MMLSDEQRRILDPSVRVVEAGPGAGKTRSLIARFVSASEQAGKGVALLSFTNSAVNEVKARTSRANLLTPPNFVGTIDSFLHRFVVSPAETPRLGRLPHYLPSWDDLPEGLHSVRIKDVPGVGIPLEAFRSDIAGSISLHETALYSDQKFYLSEVRRFGMEANLTSQAARTIEALTKRGTYSSSAARTLAYQILHGPKGEDLLSRLTTRFGEVLVDEAQDCDEAEFEILRSLSERIPVLVVADPDQAIFEFRGGTPGLFIDLRDSEPRESKMSLSENHRSTPSICQTVDSLRTAGSIQGKPKQTEDIPILVLTGTPAEQRAAFVNRLMELEITAQCSIVLSHAGNHAAKLAGRMRRTPSRANGDRLALAIAALQHSRDPEQRIKAVQTIEGVVLSLFDWSRGLRAASTSEKLEAIGRDKAWLRSLAGHLFQQLNDGERDTISSDARKLLKPYLQACGVEHAPLGNRLKKPSEKTWRCVSEALDPSTGLPASTIHAAKGLEFPAVLLGLQPQLPKDGGTDVLDDWKQKANTERLRVLYVGASRAERLLAIGAGKHSPRVEEILSGTNISFVTV